MVTVLGSEYKLTPPVEGRRARERNWYVPGVEVTKLVDFVVTPTCQFWKVVLPGSFRWTSKTTPVGGATVAQVTVIRVPPVAALLMALMGTTTVPFITAWWISQ